MEDGENSISELGVSYTIATPVSTHHPADCVDALKNALMEEIMMKLHLKQ